MVEVKEKFPENSQKNSKKFQKIPKKSQKIVEIFIEFLKNFSGCFGDGTNGNIESSYFSQGGGSLKSSGGSSIDAPTLETNDRIKIELDFDKNTVTYYKNDNLKGILHLKQRLEENSVYPAVGLSYQTSVTIYWIKFIWCLFTRFFNCSDNVSFEFTNSHLT